MKLVENTVEVQSNMQFDETVAMGIGHDAVPLIIERLISAYNNPYRAALREYTSNAYDAHVAVGQTAPIEVSMPNALSPVLRVQDFGPGLDREELKGFGQFGISTKRDSNEYTGGFGIGSKVGLAVSSQFTVVSVKNGKRNTVIVARDEQNRPNMNFLAETEVDEPNSTTIIVPITDVAHFGDLTDFFVGWKPGTILIDGDEPRRSVHNETQFRPTKNGVAWNDLSNIASGRDLIRILVNQVYYILDYKKLGLSYQQRELLKYYIVKLDNGSVTMHSSREDLIYDARTKAALQERFDAVLMQSRDAMVAQFAASADLKEALKLRDRMSRDGFPLTGLRFQNRSVVLPGDVIRGNRVPDTEGTWANPSRSHRSKTGWQVDKDFGALGGKQPWRWSDDNKLVIVHSAAPATQYGSSARRTRYAHREAFGVGEWLSAQDNSSHVYWMVFITSEKPERINKNYRDLADVFISAEDFNKTVKSVREAQAKDARNEVKEKRSKAILKVLSSFRYGTPYIVDKSVQDIKAEYESVIFLRNQGESALNNRVREAIMTKVNHSNSVEESVRALVSQGKTALILINKNDKVDDLLPLLPKVTSFEKLAIKAVNENVQKATKWDLMAVRDRSDHNVYAVSNLPDRYLDAVNRKATAKWLRSLRDFRLDTTSARDKHRWMTSYSQAVTDAISGAKNVKIPLDPSPMLRYPLLSDLGYRSDPDSVIQYINALDAYIKG